MYAFRHDEDEPGMVQLLPIEWWDYCSAQLVALAKFSNEHLDPGGAGWTDMYRPDTPPAALPRLDLSEDQFVALLSPHARRFDRILSTLGDVEETLGIRAIGFGPSQEDGEPWGNGGIIADMDGTQVRAIWCRLRARTPQEKDRLIAMASALDSHRHMLVMDWRREVVVDIRVRDQVDAYFA